MSEKKEKEFRNKHAIENRLSRAIGHLEMVKNMVEMERDYEEILIQLAAVRSAVNNTGKVILKDYLSECTEASAGGKDPEAIEKMNRAIDQFMK